MNLIESLLPRRGEKSSEGKGSKAEPMMVEVVSYMLTLETIDCHNCRIAFRDIARQCNLHEQDMKEYPEDIKRDAIRLSDWVLELSRRYPDQILIKVIDALSPQGIYKKIRYRFKKYPTFIVDHKETYTGWDKEALEAIISKCLQQRGEVLGTRLVEAET